MEADLGIQSNPLSEIKELRKERNKIKRQQRRAQKASTPKGPVETSHLTLVSEQFAQQYNVSNDKADKRHHFSDFTLADAVHVQKTPKSVKKPANNQHVAVVANILDKDQPIMCKGKHSESSRAKRLSRLKKAINNCETMRSEEEEYNYTTNVITDELKVLTTAFIVELVNAQEKYFKREPKKAQIRKRYVAGFHQVRKYLAMQKLKMIVVASDIKTCASDPLDHLITSFKQAADVNDIPLVFALTRRELGRLLLKQVPVSCMGVLNIDGVINKYKELLEELSNCKYQRFPETSEPDPCARLLEVLKSSVVIN